MTGTMLSQALFIMQYENNAVLLVTVMSSISQMSGSGASVLVIRFIESVITYCIGLSIK